MLDCCQRTLNLMQEIDGLCDCLKFYLKASPYAVLIPEMASGLLNEGVKEVVKGQIQDMVIQKALDRVTGADTLPDLAAAITSVGEMKLRLLQGQAQMHSLSARFPKHTGKETQFWNKLITLYDPAKAPAGGGSWWNPFG